MNQTTRRRIARGCGRAPAAPLLILCGLLFGHAASAKAADVLDQAESGFYIDAGTGAQPGSFFGTYNVNTLLGAERFYNAGFTGTNAVMANIEPANIWNGHETLSHVQLIPNNCTARPVKSIGTRRPSHGVRAADRVGPRLVPIRKAWLPMQLFSGAIATSWSPQSSPLPPLLTFFFANFFGYSTFGPFCAAFIDGLGPNGEGPT